jgi:hypothetical protein
VAIGCGARRSQLPPHDAMYLFQVVQQQEQRTVSSTPPAAIPSNRMPFPSPPSLDLYFPKSNAFGQQQQQQQQQQQHGIDIMSVGSSSSQSSVQGNRLVSAKYARAVRGFEEVGGRAQPRHIQLHQQQQQQQHRHHHHYQKQQQPLTEGETKMRLS